MHAEAEEEERRYLHRLAVSESSQLGRGTHGRTKETWHCSPRTISAAAAKEANMEMEDRRGVFPLHRTRRPAWFRFG